MARNHPTPRCFFQLDNKRIPPEMQLLGTEYDTMGLADKKNQKLHNPETDLVKKKGFHAQHDTENQGSM